MAQTSEQPNVQPGVRATKVREAMVEAMNRFADKCSFDKAVKCFPDLNDRQTLYLQQIYEEVLRVLKQSMQEEFDLMMEEQRLVELLNKLDALVADAGSKENQQARQPYIDAATAVRSFLTERKAIYRDELRKELAALQNENEELESTVSGLRHKYDISSKLLEEKRADLLSATSVSQELYASMAASPAL
eukprot:Colp12_sorted_trinity150504_noHs@30138